VAWARSCNRLRRCGILLRSAFRPVRVLAAGSEGTPRPDRDQADPRRREFSGSSIAGGCRARRRDGRRRTDPGGTWAGNCFRCTGCKEEIEDRCIPRRSSSGHSRSGGNPARGRRPNSNGEDCPRADSLRPTHRRSWCSICSRRPCKRRRSCNLDRGRRGWCNWIHNRWYSDCPGSIRRQPGCSFCLQGTRASLRSSRLCREDRRYSLRLSGTFSPEDIAAWCIRSRRTRTRKPWLSKTAAKYICSRRFSLLPHPRLRFSLCFKVWLLSKRLRS